MHVEDESPGENTVAEVFQAGFMLGEKVIRFAMVKVANSKADSARRTCRCLPAGCARCSPFTPQFHFR